MSETSNTKNVRDDEIDLLDLFKRMGRAIGNISRAVGRAILISIVFLLKRWLPLGLSVILGVGAAYLFKLTSPSFYSSDLVMRANAVASTSDIISYLNRLHFYCVEDNKAALADAISITPDLADNILDISAFWIIDKGSDGVPDYVDYKNNHDVYDSIDIRMQDRLNVRVIIKEPLELLKVEKGLISFINADSLFQQRNRVRLRQNLELLTRLDYDILQLDSLQKVIIEETAKRQPQAGGQMIFLQDQKTQLVYPDIYSLHSRKQSLEYERDLYRDIVTVLSEFTIPSRRVNGGLFYALRTVPLFVIVTLIVLIILANRKKLEEIYHKY